MNMHWIDLLFVVNTPSVRLKARTVQWGYAILFMGSLLSCKESTPPNASVSSDAYFELNHEEEGVRSNEDRDPRASQSALHLIAQNLNGNQTGLGYQDQRDWIGGQVTHNSLGCSGLICNGLCVVRVARDEGGQIQLMPYLEAMTYCSGQGARLAGATEWAEHHSCMLNSVGSHPHSQNTSSDHPLVFWSADRQFQTMRRWMGNVEYSVFDEGTRRLDLKSSEASPEGEDLRFAVLCVHSLNSPVQSVPHAASDSTSDSTSADELTEGENDVFGQDELEESAGGIDANDRLYTEILRAQMAFCPIPMGRTGGRHDCSPAELSSAVESSLGRESTPIWQSLERRGFLGRSQQHRRTHRNSSRRCQSSET